MCMHRQRLCGSLAPVAKTLQAGEAARALGISLDTLRRWDRQGRIRVERDAANRRVVPVREIERLRGGEGHALSARNRIAGVVQNVQIDGLLAQVEIEATERARFVAVITRESAEALGLKPGVAAAAVVKATSVMVER
jgi:molybdopterin-binding protein